MSIASELSRLLQAKSDLATSITNKGVTVPAAATLDDYAALLTRFSKVVLPYFPMIPRLSIRRLRGLSILTRGFYSRLG